MSFVSVLGFGPALADPLLLARANADPPPSADVLPAAPSPFSGGLLEFIFGGGTHSSDISEPSARPNGIELDAAGGAHPAMDPRFARQVVMYAGSEPAGTVIINTQERFLFSSKALGARCATASALAAPGFVGSASSRLR
jgi:hypothetical protein